MKIEVKDIEEVKKVKVFHPFKIELLIEDESDLEDLAVRFNANSTNLNISTATYMGYRAKDSMDTWLYIDNLLEKKPYMK